MTEPGAGGFQIWPLETFDCEDCGRALPLAWAVYLGEDCFNTPVCPGCVADEDDDEDFTPMSPSELNAAHDRWEDW